MIKFIITKNFRFRAYGLNPNVYPRKVLRIALNTKKHKFLRNVINTLIPLN